MRSFCCGGSRDAEYALLLDPGLESGAAELRQAFAQKRVEPLPASSAPATTITSYFLLFKDPP